MPYANTRIWNLKNGTDEPSGRVGKRGRRREWT